MNREVATNVRDDTLVDSIGFLEIYRRLGEKVR